jgi:trypsin-like peptidase
MKTRIAVYILVASVLPSIDEPKTVAVKTIETIQRSTVAIACVRMDAKGTITHTKIVATGFFINRRGYFLTAGHLIGDFEIADKKQGTNCFQTSLGIYVPKIPWKFRSDTDLRWFALATCQYSGSTDVAACIPAENPFEDPVVNKVIAPVVFSTVTSYGDGSPVAFTGFPMGSAYPITSKGYIAGYRTLSKELVIDKSAWGGASGSSVYDGSGKVLGMIIKASSGEQIGLAFARPSSFILDFLREKKI